MTASVMGQVLLQGLRLYGLIHYLDATILPAPLHLTAGIDQYRLFANHNCGELQTKSAELLQCSSDRQLGCLAKRTALDRFTLNS